MKFIQCIFILNKCILRYLLSSYCSVLDSWDTLFNKTKTPVPVELNILENECCKSSFDVHNVY